jgi:ketosteroid isomerase-like protein
MVSDPPPQIPPVVAQTDADRIAELRIAVPVQPAPPPSAAKAPQSNADAQAIQRTLVDLATAFSAKNLQVLLALWPSMENALEVRTQFANPDYQVQYTLRIAEAPTVQGDQAQVTAQRSMSIVSEKGGTPTLTSDNVVVTLTKTGGRWTITGMR